MKPKLYIMISLDVEEEGLFSGKYPSANLGVKNVTLLKKLAPISQQFGFPLTLFCAHSVLTKSKDTLSWMRNHCSSEIGAHLHHWSTPPFTPENENKGEPARAHKMPLHLLSAKLDTLLQAGEDFLGEPVTSFRMGRWDLKAFLLPLLAERNILVDSSVCPLRSFKDGANHFLAPADPYWLTTDKGREILEMPITQIPVSTALAKSWHKLTSGKLLDSFHFFGALSANPIWHSDKVMRIATNAHARRGGRVLNLFWHSSEMYPSGSPHIPDQAAADNFLAKIMNFCAWLRENYDAQGVTATGFYNLAKNLPLKELTYSPDRDW